MQQPLSCYLAGPFFNEAQIKLVRDLETLLDPHYKVWSPSRDGQVLGLDATEEDKERVFESNYSHILKTDFMIAIVQPNDPRPIATALKAFDGHKLWSCSIDEETTDCKYTMSEIRNDLRRQRWPQYPDVGTVWEMGVAYQASKAIIAVTADKLVRPNLMLAESCRGVAIGLDQVLDVVGRVLNGETVKYQGPII